MAPFAASDQEVMMAVVHRDGLLLRLAHDALKVQRVIVDFYSGQLRLYTLCFSLLTCTFGRLFSSSEAQVDEEVVFEAVRQNRVALRFAADELRSDGETHEPNIHSRVD